ncbi:sn-glycerol-3-phosphate transport system permease protein UgpE [Aureimonas endophytica]|uniref:sn-glycerol-3-phosphate transport system permease protein UgpE n=1 Tax=Aureimonas endophytica TaxID=2027858 RepID=A0A916ZPG3_9HYPH|nr:ABC transporter permease subunit [Aureimonas endophytica]GGE07684.1 sn-glycerol-3-phosphate transport system permease protein UgpE [Aureimonas endophytica]
MIEKTPLANIVTYGILLAALATVLLPFWIVFCAATQSVQQVNAVPFSFLPGGDMLQNFAAAWQRAGLGTALLNSFAMAGLVTGGKIAVSALSAFAIVYFRSRWGLVFFWLVFLTLMLPLEVRVVPTYNIAADAFQPFRLLIQFLTGIEISFDWNLLNTYSGLTLPLVATATGTFLFRQFFMTVPDELAEAARMDGSGPWRFFVDILLPLSRTNMLALATILFADTWNQYLWPRLMVTDPAYMTAMTALRILRPSENGLPDWNVTNAGALIIVLPPLIVVAVLQRWFVRGLIATEK